MPSISLRGTDRACLIDEQDVPAVARHRWGLNSRGYVCRNSKASGSQRMVLLHRQIMAAPVGMQVDHINGDRLDNRRANLRLCTQSQNNANARSGGGRSRFRGVSLHRQSGLWRARIQIDGAERSLGYFDTEAAAAHAYDVAAIAHFGEFARPNYHHSTSCD